MNSSSFTETFIKNHVELLPNVSNVIYGSDGKYSENGTSKLLYRKYSIAGIMKRFGAVYSGSERYLTKYLIKNKITHVLAEYGITAIDLVGSCEKLSLPLIVHFHGFDANNRRVVEKHLEQYKRLFKYAKAIIAVSSSMRDRLITYGSPANKTFHLVYGVDTKKFRLSVKHSQTEPKFISVGRLINMKAPYLTLLAFKKFRDKNSKGKLVFIGNNGFDGSNNPIFSVMTDLVIALGLQEHVSLLGDIQHEKVSEYFQSATAFLLHSVTVRDGGAEGTPNVILEGMASGLPIVSTKHEGIQDVVEHGKQGFLVEERDIESMSKYMEVLAFDEELAIKMGREGRRKAEENYTLEESIAKLHQIILQ